jgi:hypothetical protein
VPSQRPQRGRSVRVDAPEWEPLLNLASDHVGDFMWMYALELSDGTRLQAYKHCWTRNYLYLSDDGRAFAYVKGERYEEVNPLWLLMRVLEKELDSSPRYSVRQNVWPEEAQITFARSATKHRISRERALYVIEHCGIQFAEKRRSRARFGADPRVWFFGDDLEEVPLEVMAAEVGEEEFLVIHAMKLRDHHLGLYEEGRAWRK